MWRNEDSLVNDRKLLHLYNHKFVEYQHSVAQNSPRQLTWQFKLIDLIQVNSVHALANGWRL